LEFPGESAVPIFPPSERARKKPRRRPLPELRLNTQAQGENINPRSSPSKRRRSAFCSSDEAKPDHLEPQPSYPSLSQSELQTGKLALQPAYTPCITTACARAIVTSSSSDNASGTARARATHSKQGTASSDMSEQPLLQSAPGKRIALPTRVEPKVFFANERTFLSWLNFTVILGGLAVGLLNFGDSVGRISAGLFTLVAMAAMIYALFTFHWRAKSIRLRGQGGFDDRIGPTVLALALLGAVVVNFVLRVVEA